MALKITALAGGTGGAKLVDGLTGLLGPDLLTLVVNTGDDFTHLGLHISPDLQVIVNPGGTDTHDVSVIGGLRMQMDL